MPIRNVLARSVTRVAGPQRTARLRQLDAKVRARLIDALDVERSRQAPAPSRKAAKPARPGSKRKPQARKARANKAVLTRAERIEAIGRANAEGYLDDKGGVRFVSPDPFASFAEPTASRHQLLAGLHERLRPRTYWEVGVDYGQSLTLSRTRSIGVDPFFTINRPIWCDVRLFRETSDDYFRRPDAFDHFEDVPVDLAFIDGMHLAEYALRDFMNIEKHMAPGGIAVIDDMLPRNAMEAYRVRRTVPWTGDVYKIHDVLATYRPDLTLVLVNTSPTGTMIVAGTDPTSTVLDDHYAEIETGLISPDPQVVSDEWLERRMAVAADELLERKVWGEIVDLRDNGGDRAAFAPLWQQLG